jgi:hypothetical protein
MSQHKQYIAQTYVYSSQGSEAFSGLKPAKSADCYGELNFSNTLKFILFRGLSADNPLIVSARCGPGNRTVRGLYV